VVAAFFEENGGKEKLKRGRKLGLSIFGAEVDKAIRINDGTVWNYVISLKHSSFWLI
jgi:hypothetical protein